MSGSAPAQGASPPRAVALDTNQAIALMNGAEAAVRSAEPFQTLVLPVPVIGELRYGAINSGRPEANLARVDAFCTRCRAIDIDPTTAAAYATMRAALKKRGTPIPENDVWIAAQCLQHGLPLATADRHFAGIEGLTVLAW